MLSVCHTIRPVAGLLIASRWVFVMRGIKTPLLVLVISSIELAAAVEVPKLKVDPAVAALFVNKILPSEGEVIIERVSHEIVKAAPALTWPVNTPLLAVTLPGTVKPPAFVNANCETPLACKSINNAEDPLAVFVMFAKIAVGLPLVFHVPVIFSNLLASLPVNDWPVKFNPTLLLEGVNVYDPVPNVPAVISEAGIAPDDSVPTDVSDDDTTVLFKVVPDKVPAGAITAFPADAVSRPWASTV